MEETLTLKLSYTNIREYKLPLKKRSLNFEVSQPETPPMEDVHSTSTMSSVDSNIKTTKPSYSRPKDLKRPINAQPLAMFYNNRIVRFVDDRQGPTKRRKVEEDSVDESKAMLESLVENLKTTFNYKDLSDPKIILKKKLTKSDILDHQGRLSIPANMLLTSFLSEFEELYLNEKLENKKNTKIDVKVIVGDSEYMMSLSRWNYHDKNKNNNENNNIDNNNNKNNNNKNNNENKKKKAGGWKYVLKNGWTRLKNKRQLIEGDIIRLASFRSNNELHMAIICPLNLNLEP